MVARRADSPHVPLSAQEIIDDGVACVACGASILHLHARAADGTPTWERAAVREIITGLRTRCPAAILCATTSGRDVRAFDRRSDVLRLEGAERPDMASLTLGSLNFRTQASINEPDTISALARLMLERGIRPELEIFDSGMAYLAAEHLHRGLLRAPLYANLILGGPNTAPATAHALAHLVDVLPQGTIWAAGGLGAFQLPVTAMAVFMGGHVRTGLEDNLWMDAERERPATNPDLVSRVAALAEIAGRRVATPEEARARLGLGAPEVSAPGRARCR